MIRQVSPLPIAGRGRQRSLTRRAATWVGSCGIVGAGNSAHALACYLSQQGWSVHLYARRKEQIEHLQDNPIVQATGKIQGQFVLAGVGSHPAEMAQRCSTIFLCTTANAYPDVVAQLGPHLKLGHTLVLFSSKLCGSLEVHQTLRSMGREGVRVIETDALFACRLQEDRSIWIRGFKGWNLYSAPTQAQTCQARPLMRMLFAHLEPATSLIQRGLTDFGALAHALTVLVNMNSVDRQQPFLFYYEGFTQNTVVLLEQLEREMHSLAAAYGVSLIPASELLNRYYGCDTTSLLQSMRSVPNYRHSLAPTTLNTRYLSEDVACTLVPAQQLAARAGLRTPVLDSIVSMTSVLHGVDYQSSGRTLEKLGWGEMTAGQIRRWTLS